MGKTDVWEREGLVDIKFSQLDVDSFSNPELNVKWKLVKARFFFKSIQWIIDAWVLINLMSDDGAEGVFTIFTISLVFQTLFNRKNKIKAEKIIKGDDISDCYINDLAKYMKQVDSFGTFCLFHKIDKSLTKLERRLQKALRALDTWNYLVGVIWSIVSRVIAAKPMMVYVQLFVWLFQLIVTIITTESMEQKSFKECREQNNIAPNIELTAEKYDELGCGSFGLRMKQAVIGVKFFM